MRNKRLHPDLYLILIIGLALFIAGCTQQAPAPSPQPSETTPPPSSELPAPAPTLPVCILTPDLVYNTCQIPRTPAQLSSRLYHGDCEVNAGTARGEIFFVVTFKNVSLQTIESQFDQLEYEQQHGPAGDKRMEEIPGLGDRALVIYTPSELIRDVEYQNDFEIYFQAGNKGGKFSSNGDQVWVYDTAQQQAVPIGGGCDIDEAKEIIQNTIIPYLNATNA